MHVPTAVMRLGGLVLLALPLGTSAQFSGGIGRGDFAPSFAPAPSASSIFSGGTGRGDIATAFAPAASASSIFSGGTGRGDISSVFAPAPSASSIFSGGTGRGDIATAFVPAPSASSIFSGGIGRGDNATAFAPAPSASSIFSGGTGRGDVASLITPAIIPSNIFSGGNGRGDVATAISNQPAPQLLLALHGVLEGPYSSSTGLMSDALRAAGIVPTTEPYTVLGYAHTGGGGAESIASSVLATTGTNAIVDWVVVELRDATTPTTVLATRSALVQRDGDVVSTDGISPLTFTNAPGTYHVVLRHRNHLAVMTGNATALGLSTTPLDLASAGTTTYGTAARKSVSGTFPAEVLWAGDVTFNGTVKYTGSGNDRDPILTRIGGSTPTNTVSGYWREDCTLDGTVKYTGSGNDRDPILLNIGGSSPTNTRSAQLP